jgi:hypothetical protein
MSKVVKSFHDNCQNQMLDPIPDNVKLDLVTQKRMPRDHTVS